MAVSTGLFGASQSFVPLAEATLEGDNVRVPFDKDKVTDAPRVDADLHLDVEQERELYRYHGLDFAAVTGAAPTKPAPAATR